MNEAANKTVALRASPTFDLTKIEQVLVKGDLSVLKDAERINYYRHICETVGLNPATKPFEYLVLSGRTVLYATKGCAEQLRSIHRISIRIMSRETIEGVYIVTAAAQGVYGRVDESTGAVQIAGLKGDMLANAMMKAETKAKRRVTLSICGLNMLDETEVETIKQPRQQRTVFADQPGPNDGAKLDGPTVYTIPKGEFARKKIHEIPEADLRRVVERLESDTSLESWELTFLDRAKEFLVTLDQMEPAEEPIEPQPSAEPKSAPQCCGKDMLISKFPDRATGKVPYWCTECKAKRPVESWVG